MAATYTAVLEGPTGTREITVAAAGHRAALALAREACREGEFVRGVVECRPSEFVRGMA